MESFSKGAPASEKSSEASQAFGAFSSKEQKPGSTLVQLFAELIYKRLGLHFSKDKLDHLSLKLGKFARKQGDQRLEDLLAKLEAGNSALFDSLVEAVTVNHTYFFREPEHFPLLFRDLENRRLQRPLLWSAASSSGEEPYSLTILLREKGFNAFRVLASDIDKDALRSMHQGVYRDEQLEALSRFQRDQFFVKIDENKFKVKAEIRAHLIIKRLNLMEDFELPQKVDYIFCRNALIYFDDSSRLKVVANLVNSLAPGGLLFLGHTETLLTCPKGLLREAHSTFRKL